MNEGSNSFDLLIIGGGINGAGIARDAVGRGLSVALCERGDLGAATSSSSSKLIHGGLRYLETLQFRLVREALTEREILMHTAAHLVKPLRFLLPHVPRVRAGWKIMAGLLLYEHLSKRTKMSRSKSIRFQRDLFGSELKLQYRKGFAYSDCLVDDARLVIANAKAAAAQGATIMVRVQFLGATMADGAWRVTLRDHVTGQQFVLHARVLANATGPWIPRVAKSIEGWQSTKRIRLVKGSHIVVPKLHQGEYAYLLQNEDKRVVFVIPYERSFSLVGTTDIAFDGTPEPVVISDEEVTYLCKVVTRFFTQALSPQDVVWQYAGLRPLYDDGSNNPSAITRDYGIDLWSAKGVAPVVTIYGGKLTTYRSLAERVLEKLADILPHSRRSWTRSAPLPGSDLPQNGLPGLLQALTNRYSKLPLSVLMAIAQRHGTLTWEVLEGAEDIASLGKYFGADLFEREVDYLIRKEWAHTAEDILWRRTETGLHLVEDQRQRLGEYVARTANSRIPLWRLL